MSQYTNASGGPVLHAAVPSQCYNINQLNGQTIYDGQLVYMHPPELRIPGCKCELIFNTKEKYKYHMGTYHAEDRANWPPKKQLRRVSLRGRSGQFYLLMPTPTSSGEVSDSGSEAAGSAAAAQALQAAGDLADQLDQGTQDHQEEGGADSGDQNQETGSRAEEPVEAADPYAFGADEEAAEDPACSQQSQERVEQKWRLINAEEHRKLDEELESSNAKLRASLQERQATLKGLKEARAVVKQWEEKLERNESKIASNQQALLNCKTSTDLKRKRADEQMEKCIDLFCTD